MILEYKVPKGEGDLKPNNDLHVVGKHFHYNSALRCFKTKSHSHIYMNVNIRRGWEACV